VNSTKRQRILDAMLEAVGDEGYEGTSIRSVLARSGLYRQAFYDNFASKEDCFLQAYDAALKRIEAGILAAASPQVSWLAQLRAGLGALLDFLDSETEVSRALIVEVHPAGGAALARRAAAVGRAREFLARGAAAGGIGTPPPIAPEAIASGIHAIVHSRLASRDADGFHELLPELMYIAALPYFGAAVAKAEMGDSQA
jgi:AcrR family transcriptional regulator